MTSERSWPSRPSRLLSSLRGQRVTIVEVGPRDGLQNEAVAISTTDKVHFIDALTAAGLPAVEVGAFVNPARVPRMSDSEAVAMQIQRRSGVRYSALVPNVAGLDRAIAAGISHVAIFAASSEAFSRANINATIDESFVRFTEVAARAREHDVTVRGYLSTAFGCPYQGAVDPVVVATLTRRLLDLGCYEVAVSDTIGIAHPAQVEQVLGVVLSQARPADIALHFHDTRGTALANVLVGLECGIRTFDASAGGLGGCPYAPGATGNLATEDLVYMLDGLGVVTGVNLERLVAASRLLESSLGHQLPSRYLAAIRAGRGRA